MKSLPLHVSRLAHSNKEECVWSPASIKGANKYAKI